MTSEPPVAPTPDLLARLDDLTTPHLADACVRLGVPVRCAPVGLRPAVAGDRVAGRVLPARHTGSVDVFLEAFEAAVPGDVLVVDNGGRIDESCVGDLAVLEAVIAGVTGVVIWGLHRDTTDLLAVGLPVFSMGTLPAGPQRVHPRPAEALVAAVVGAHVVTAADVVMGDDDGVVFLPGDRMADLVPAAEAIRDVERAQAERIRAGRSLREQVDFAGFLAAREADPGLTFRRHLRSVGGAVEE